MDTKCVEIGVAQTPLKGHLTEPETPAVDCDILVASKENIQPLTKGRSATTLSAVFSTPLVRREAKLSRERAIKRKMLSAALEDGDLSELLNSYKTFVYWTVENYPQGHSTESGIVELLEEATRVLKERSLDTLKDNDDYIKLWYLYADYVERPSIVYGFLLANDIGTQSALTYEVYAEELEREGRRKEADDIYALGIARKAQPLSRLEARHRAFQKRMMSGVCLPSIANMPSRSHNVPAHVPRRPVLGSSGTVGNGRTVIHQEDDVFSSARLNPGHTPFARPHNRVSVFTDNALNESDAISPSNWPDLGTKKTRVKENKREITKPGNGIPLGSKKLKGPSAKISAFVPFEDEESGGQPPNLDALDMLQNLAETRMHTKPSPPRELLDEQEAGSRAQPTLHSTAGQASAMESPSVQSNSKCTLCSKLCYASKEAEAIRKDPFKNHTKVKEQHCHASPSI